jgi:hypothetical protein
VNGKYEDEVIETAEGEEEVRSFIAFLPYFSAAAVPRYILRLVVQGAAGACWACDQSLMTTVLSTMTYCRHQSEQLELELHCSAYVSSTEAQH